jgi:Family of unknown function (DUF6311)
MLDRRTINLPLWSVVLFAITIFLLKFGLIALDVTNYGWFMQMGADVPTEYVSWCYYRLTPWHFPVIGTMEGYMYPTVTGVGQTGAIPLVAIPLKAISGILPANFQFFGWWLLLCYVLQGWFGWQLLRALTADTPRVSPWALALGAMFFVVAPPLLYRAGHINLCSHFLLTAGLWLFFERNLTAEQKIRYVFVLVLATASIHQYLTLMILGLAVAILLQLSLQKQLRWFAFVGILVALLGGIMGIFYLIGNFNIPILHNQTSGFGNYSSNLNVFFNSQGMTRFLPAMPLSSEGQYEGYGYLGLGALGLVLTVLIPKKYLTPQIRTPFVWVIWAVAGLMTIYALSDHVWFNQMRIVRYDLNFMEFITNSFRSSGRFCWTLHYLILAMLLTQFLRWQLRAWQQITALALVFCVQLADISPLLHFHVIKTTPYEGAINISNASRLMKECERVVMYPTMIQNYHRNVDYIDFSLAAIAAHKSISTGYLARLNWSQLTPFAEHIDRCLHEGTLEGEERSLFITTVENRPKFERLLEKQLVKIYLFENDYLLIVPNALHQTQEYLTE